MGERTRRMTAKQVETLLRRHGFHLISQRGSHRKWRHETRALQVIVPEHGGRVLPVGTIRNVLKNAEIPEHEWTS